MLHGEERMTYVGNLDPLLQTLVPREDLHTGLRGRSQYSFGIGYLSAHLCVWVVSGFEPKLVVARLCVELLHEA